MNFLKKYWDIIGGIVFGIIVAVKSQFSLDIIQLCYSIIIMVLVSIGVFRMLKQEIEKQRHEKKRRETIIDSIIDGQKPVKAISLAETPTKEGEKMGKSLIIIFGGIKAMIEKLKTFFSKFKGYMLTAALAVLTLVEMCGGFINAAFGGTLTVNGIAIIPLVTLGCTAIVGIVSNGYTPEQREKIKALFSKSTTQEMVIAEIKKTIKEKTTQLAQYNKVLVTQQHEFENLESELETLSNTLHAKKEMCAMIPQLATETDVELADNAYNECKAKIEVKKDEITKTETTINNLTTALNALKSQLN